MFAVVSTVSVPAAPPHKHKRLEHHSRLDVGDQIIPEAVEEPVLVGDEILGVKLLMGDPSTARYWVGGSIPKLRPEFGPRQIACSVEQHRQLDDIPFCEQYWPSDVDDGEMVSVYDIGIGGEFGFGTYQPPPHARA